MLGNQLDLLVSQNEIPLFQNITGLLDVEAARAFYLAAAPAPIGTENTFDFYSALACVFIAGRVQGIREERARKKKKIEQLQAAAVQQSERGK